MPDLPQIVALRDKLIESRLAGVLSIRDSNGETITYKSDAEMAAAIRYAEDAIARLQRSIPNTVLFRTSKGL